MNYIILSLTESPFELRYLARFYEKLKELGIESKVIFYGYDHELIKFIPKEKIIFDKSLGDYVRKKDHKIYEKFLNFACEKNLKIVIPRLVHPEFLYSSLISLEEIPSISLSGYGFELFIRSKSRANIVRRILELKNVKRLLLHTIGGKDSKWPNKFPKKEDFSNKIVLNSEPLFDSIDKYKGDKDEAKIFFGIDTKKIVILFFGSFYPWKGPDLLLNAIKFLDNSFQIIFAGNTDTYSKDLSNFEKENILLFDKPGDHKMYKLFHASDIVTCPYGPTYKYSSSSVFMSSILSSKPAVVPSFEPFNNVIDTYKCGEMFDQGDLNSFVNSINIISNNIRENPYYYNLNFERYISSIITWEEIIKFHIS